MAIAIDSGTALVNGEANDAADVNARFTTMDASIEDALSWLTEITDGLNVETTSVAAGAIKTVMEVEWDPSNGSNLTDNASGVAIDLIMPDDADNQDVFARIIAMCVSDATGAEEGEISLRGIDGGTANTEWVTVSGAGTDILIGKLTVQDATDSTSTTTGSIQTDGGLGVAKDLYVGDDILMASGGVINFAASNSTITHSTGLLTHNVAWTNTGLITATAGVTSGSNIISDADSTDDLGTASVRWANVYTDSIGDTSQDLTVAATTVNLPTGHIFDYNDGNAVITHSSGVINVSTGALQVGGVAVATGAGVSLSGSTNNTIVTVTGANAMLGEANLTFDGAILEARGAVATPGRLHLTTAELTVVDGNVLGKIDFSAPLESSGDDAIAIAASIWAEADDTFAADNNATDLVFATGSSEIATEKMRIDSDGYVTKPSNCYVSVWNSAADNDVSGDGTVYTIAFDTEIDDIGANFSSTTFTAPVTGKYLIQGSIYLAGINTSHEIAGLNLVTSNRTYRFLHLNPGIVPSDNNYPISLVADMDATDTFTITLTASGSSKVVDVGGGALATYLQIQLVQ
jgi:hypothetical protein